MLQPAIRLICRTEGALAPGASAPLAIHWRTRLTTPSDRFMRYSLGSPHCLERLGLSWRRLLASACRRRRAGRIIALDVRRASANGKHLAALRGLERRRCAVQKRHGTVLTKTPGFC